MRNEWVAPETKGVTVKLLATVDLGPVNRGRCSLCRLVVSCAYYATPSPPRCPGHPPPRDGAGDRADEPSSATTRTARTSSPAWPRLAEQGALTVYAWALLPNHAHLLVRTGTRPLARSMRCLLTGLRRGLQPPPPAGRPPLPEPVQVHRGGGGAVPPGTGPLPPPESPPGAGGPRLRALDRYPWTGHSALLGTCPAALAGDRDHPRPVRPHPAPGPARLPGLRGRRDPPGRRPEFQGGGLVRSLGGWAARRGPPPGAGGVPGG